MVTLVPLLVVVPAFTFTVVDPDSAVRSYALDEVVVTATRAEALRSTVATAVTVLDSSRISLTAGTLLSSALATTPGVSVREYGGDAAVRSISMRGFGPENVLVLVDGQRINSDANGGVDFGLVPLTQVDRVEVVRGGQSGLYGADAVGGIVNIKTRRPSGAFGAGIETTIGGFGFSALEARVEGGGGAASWRMMGRRERGSGGYGFTFDDGVTTQPLTRTGSDFKNERLDGKIEFQAAEDLTLRARGAWLQADRGSPGPVTDPSSAGRARLYDHVATAQAGMEWTIDAQLKASALADVRYGDERYVDPATLLGGVPLDSRSTNRSFSVEPRLQWNPLPGSLVALDAELDRAWMTGTETHDALRWHGGVALSGQQVVSPGGGNPFELVLYPSVRLDDISDVGHDLSAKIGVNIGLVDQPLVRLRASYGKNFRAPTFNELYWITGGNPDLRPERSLSGDVGVTVMLDLWGPLSIDLSGFRIQSRDRIVWVPATGIYWSPQNIGEVVSRGLEAEARWKLLAGRLELVVNSTWMTARKTSSDYPGDPTEGSILVYTPKQTATIEATVHAGPADLGVQNVWTSFRYTTPANDEYLPAYTVTSAVLRTRVSVAGATLHLRAEVLNLFNTGYASIALYPMPGREVRGTVGVEL